MNLKDKAIASTIRMHLLKLGLTRSDLAKKIGVTPRGLSNLLAGNDKSPVRRILIEEELGIALWSSQEEFNVRQVRLTFFGHEIEMRNVSSLRDLVRSIGIVTGTESFRLTRSQLIERLSAYARKELLIFEKNLRNLTQPQKA